MVYGHILGLFLPSQQELDESDDGFDFDPDFDEPTYWEADLSDLGSEPEITEPSSSDDDEPLAPS